MAGKGLPPERVRAVLDLLAPGVSPNRAAGPTGVSVTYAYGLHHKMGGVYRPADTSCSDRYLDREERYEIARLRGAGLSGRVIAARPGRSPSTVSRELARNRDPRTGQYMPERAHRLAGERQRRPKPSKLARTPALRGEVQALLRRRHSPGQASGRLGAMHPDDPSMQVSHETICQSIYVCRAAGSGGSCRRPCAPGGAPASAAGGASHAARSPGRSRPASGPPGVQGRLVPGHHEGDLLTGSTASSSAVATVVERVTGYLTLVPLPHGHTADAVADAVTDRLQEMPAWFARTLAWDRGVEMARHARVTAETGVRVYFADPHAPWQRGSNENLNGLLREYLPKGTDLSAVTPEQLQYIQDELNDRRRKRHGYYTPASNSLNSSKTKALRRPPESAVPFFKQCD